MKTIVLDSTNKTLKAKLSGAPATTNPDFVVSWADSSATAFAEGASDVDIAEVLSYFMKENKK